MRAPLLTVNPTKAGSHLGGSKWTDLHENGCSTQAATRLPFELPNSPDAQFPSTVDQHAFLRSASVPEVRHLAFLQEFPRNSELYRKPPFRNVPQLRRANKGRVPHRFIGGIF
jgi:hypothetical protein